jgi:uroporphyrinogen-III decarboxylase
MGMTNTAINLIGLENLMIFMYDSPEGLHRLMQFLHDDYRDSLAWFQEEGLLTLDNENDYIGSGSMGYTDDLPQPDFDGEHVRLRDLWCLSESQETVGVGPEQFAEFIFPYQKDLADRFGKCYYGCCEPVHNRWHVLKGLENLARVSVSPWCDQAFMAEACGESIVFSRKPSPTLVSTGTFDEEAIREDLRETLRHAGNCRLEIVMKDVHTLNEEPDRLPRWVAMAREECGAG